MQVRRLLSAMAVSVGAGLIASACSTYSPSPLPTAPDLASGPSDPAQYPLTVSQVVAAVLRNNPDLMAGRTQHNLAKAQVLQAGLLPDPAFSGAILPLLAGPGNTLAWNASLTEDVRSILTLKAKRQGAKAAAFQIDAQVLWQEWQTASQAQLLAVQLIGGERTLVIDRAAARLFSDRSTRLQRALAEGNVTLQTAAPDLAALQTARAQVDAAERQQLARRHQLNALMGREPDAPLVLSDQVDLAALDAAAVDRLAADTARRRPDLIALRLGYRAQEAKTRLAVMMQFPALVLGATGGSDNSNVRNGGPQFSFNLPIFDGNRGDIAIQKATRAQLRAEYLARLDAAYGQVRAAVTELKAAQAQLAVVRADLPAAERAATAGERAFQTGIVDELTYVDLVNARISKEGEIVALEQAVLEQESTIVALVGAGLPSVDQLPDIAA